MSVEPAVAERREPVAATVPDSTARVRAAVVSGVLTLSSLAVAAVLLWSPFPDRDHLTYAAIVPVRNGTWVGFLVETLGYGLASMAVCVAVCRLAPRRGAVLATVGSVLTAVGGLLFAAAALATGALTWYATDTSALSPAAGTTFVAYVKDNPAHLIAADAIGFVALTVGLVLLSIALGRARSVPRWLPIALIVLLVAQFPTPGRALDVVQALIMVGFVAIAYFYRRATAATG